MGFGGPDGSGFADGSTVNGGEREAPPGTEDALELVFAPLDQAGPGSDASTLAALAALQPIPDGGAIYDLGCGPGRQTLALARELGRPITAVDVNRTFLDRLIVRAENAGLGEAVTVREASMVAFDAAPQSIDLIWAEGAVYIVGVEAALKSWRPLLRPGGCVGFTELVWLTDSPPEPAAQFWRYAYPSMTGVVDTQLACVRQGYEVVATRALPADDWQAGYYQPLSRRIEALRPRAAAWPELAAVLAEIDDEMAVFNAHHGSFAYVFFLLRKAG